MTMGKSMTIIKIVAGFLIALVIYFSIAYTAYSIAPQKWIDWLRRPEDRTLAKHQHGKEGEDDAVTAQPSDSQDNDNEEEEVDNGDDVHNDNYHPSRSNPRGKRHHKKTYPMHRIIHRNGESATKMLYARSPCTTAKGEGKRGRRARKLSIPRKQVTGITTTDPTSTSTIHGDGTSYRFKRKKGQTLDSLSHRSSSSSSRHPAATPEFRSKDDMSQKRRIVEINRRITTYRSRLNGAAGIEMEYRVGQLHRDIVELRSTVYGAEVFGEYMRNLDKFWQHFADEKKRLQQLQSEWQEKVQKYREGKRALELERMVLRDDRYERHRSAREDYQYNLFRYFPTSEDLPPESKLEKLFPYRWAPITVQMSVDIPDGVLGNVSYCKKMDSAFEAIYQHLSDDIKVDWGHSPYWSSGDALGHLEARNYERTELKNYMRILLWRRKRMREKVQRNEVIYKAPMDQSISVALEILEDKISGSLFLMPWSELKPRTTKKPRWIQWNEYLLGIDPKKPRF
jgi:hypothetical protein